MANIKKDGSYSSRHRGAFTPDHPSPFELSRGKIEMMVRCEACFWLEKRAGVKPIGMPGFNLNTNTDTLLKRDLDQCRGRGPHPIMVEGGYEHLRPFEHEDLKKWESSTQFGAGPRYFNAIHDETNILFGGGLDDVWENSATGELHIVDYKSTAQLSDQPKPLDKSFLDDLWKVSYKRQMEMYQWILRRKGFQVSDIGYFLYVDGQHLGYNGMIDSSDPSMATMKFKTAIIEYEGNDGWVENAIRRAKEILQMQEAPGHSSRCEVGRFLKEANQASP